MTYKSEDYKYLQINTTCRIKIILEKTCKIFYCKKIYITQMSKKIHYFQKSYKAKQKTNIL